MTNNGEPRFDRTEPVLLKILYGFAARRYICAVKASCPHLMCRMPLISYSCARGFRSRESERERGGGRERESEKAREREQDR